MRVKERRAREQAQHRQRILGAALAIITQEGFPALSMRRLAERIGYSAASLYLHFESREQIAQELRHAGFEQLLNRMEEAVKDLVGREALRAMGAAYTGFGREQPQLYRLMFMGEPGLMQAAYGGRASDAVADRAYRLLLGVVQTLGGIWKEKAAPTEIADVIWSCLHGMVSLHLALPGLQVTPIPVQEKLSLELLVLGLEQVLAG